MPTVIDATVVNQAYDTSGNGGRKLVRLSNGWLVAAVYDGTSVIYFYKSADNGSTWSQLCYIINLTESYRSAPSLASKGTRVYVITNNNTKIAFLSFDATTVTNTDQQSNVITLDNQSSISHGSHSLIINQAGTELHAAWASKNSTYPNSFNIRYAKGTINADGSVTWGSVEQVTTRNTSSVNFVNPSIVLDKDNIPHIINKIGNVVLDITKAYTSKEFDGSYIKSDWGNKRVYDGGAYEQSSPSACVDKNGRIWVAWHGRDAMDPSVDNIRVAYSDDGGVTWSSMTKLTSGNNPSTNQQQYPSITSDKQGNVYIVWMGQTTSSAFLIRKIMYNGTWGSVVDVGSSNTKFPSTLFDPTFTLDFSSPLFIFRDDQTSKVGFYGTWTASTISVTPGYIGQKTSADKSNILTYSITTDGEMSDIIEKINGVTIATRTNPTSGQQFTVSLTQEQWDAIKFGNGHTLTIEMGSDTWTYTFDKRLHANDDVLSAVKGVHDLQDHLNAVKAQLAEAIRAKGGTVNDTDAWSAFVSAVGSMQAKRWASGTAFSDSSYRVTVSGLAFRPRHIFMREKGLATPNNLNYSAFYSEVIPNSPLSGYTDTSNPYAIIPTITDDGFTLRISNQNRECVWIAFE